MRIPGTGAPRRLHIYAALQWNIGIGIAVLQYHNMPLRTKLVVQDPPDASAVSSNPYHTVVFKHPGYQDDNNRVLTLPAYDDPNGGFDLDTAKTICGILAGNRWDGFFTHEQDGPPVQVLEASAEYYFILPDASGSY